MKFKTINGTLCLITEPKPLTEKDNLPAAVGLIIDDSRMGKLNEYESRRLGRKTIIAIEINENGVVRANDRYFYEHYTRYEIIGYPVADHSAEWALWQMMQGNKVASRNGTVYWQDKDDNDLIKYTDGYGQKWIQTPYLFLRCVDASGWQIYKPKPLLAEAKVGDLVKVQYSNGDSIYAQITFADGSIVCIDKKIFNYDLHGRCLPLEDNDTHCIISTEPLAPEGSAEWAWQMWCLLGKEIMHPKVEEMAIFPCNVAETVLFGYVASYWQEKKADWLNTCNGHNMLTGWQLYEPAKPEHPAINGYNRYDYIPVEGIAMPKPAPAFKVGDWVEHSAGQLKLVEKSIPPDTAMWKARNVNGDVFWIYEHKIIRILSPADVKVDFGSFRGTIEVNSHPFNRQITVKGTQGHAIAYINIVYLDTPTRELVEALLKAQEKGE